MRRNTEREAIEKLVKLGILIPYDDSLRLYHGRAGTHGDEWQVDPAFSNGGNETRHMNLNTVSALNAANREVAEKFARQRARESGRPTAEPQVHRIVADGEAYIVRRRRDLTTEQQQEARDAIDTLLSMSLTKHVPFSWEDRKFGWEVYSYLNRKLYHSRQLVLDEQDCKALMDELSSDENMETLFKDVTLSAEEIRNGVSKKEHVRKLVFQIVSARNTRRMLHYNLAKTVDAYVTARRLMTNEDGDLWIIDNVPYTRRGQNTLSETLVVPMSSQYIASWLAAANIVGFVTNVDSATLNHETIQAYYLFDKERINTERVIGDRQRRMIEEYEKLEQICGAFFDSSTANENPILKVIENGTPEEIIDFLLANEPYKKYFELDSGVHEGFTVAQHTESVLEWFDVNYKNCLPKNVETFMKLCLVAHDIGKGVAYKEGVSQKYKNEEISMRFFKSLGLNPNMAALAEFIIGKGQYYTTRYYISKDESAKEELKRESDILYRNAFSIDPTDEENDGIWQICAMLQNCDSGAYTRRGITRDGTGYHLNENYRFTASFTTPNPGTGRKGGKLKEPGETN